jgi:hypothetical protein
MERRMGTERANERPSDERRIQESHRRYTRSRTRYESPFHLPQLSSQHRTNTHGLTGQQTSMQTWASGPSHLHPPNPIARHPSPPSPRSTPTWHPAHVAPQRVHSLTAAYMPTAPAPVSPGNPVTPQPAPSPRARDFLSNQRGHVTASKERALPEPAVTLLDGDVAPRAHIPTPANPVPASITRETVPHANATRSPTGFAEPGMEGRPESSPVAPTASTLPITHGLHDFSALCSGTRNPWGSINHRHHRSQPARVQHRDLGPRPLQYSPFSQIYGLSP